MKSFEEQVKELLATDSEKISLALPAPFYQRLVLVGRRKFGTIAKPELMPKAVAHAAALGLILWEKELKSGSRKRKTISKHNRSKTNSLKHSEPKSEKK